MDFEKIPHKRASEFSGYIEFEDVFYQFVKEFEIEGVHWSQPTSLSASYLLRLLLEGSVARARGYGRGNNIENDENSQQMQPFYHTLLDHGAMWRLSDGKVICTAMPYGTKESIIDSFNRMVNEFKFPKVIKLEFLEDRFKYRSNGHYMIVIYAADRGDDYIPGMSCEEVMDKMKNSSSPVRCKLYKTSSYMRSKYVSDYAKKRANGICQLCGNKAPFETRNGEPYLEAHHIIPLADDGPDSLDNIVALCPSCHRKMHSLCLDEDIEHLLNVVKEFNTIS